MLPNVLWKTLWYSMYSIISATWDNILSVVSFEKSNLFPTLLLNCIVLLVLVTKIQLVISRKHVIWQKNVSTTEEEKMRVTGWKTPELSLKPQILDSQAAAEAFKSSTETTCWALTYHYEEKYPSHSEKAEVKCHHSHLDQFCEVQLRLHYSYRQQEPYITGNGSIYSIMEMRQVQQKSGGDMSSLVNPRYQWNEWNVKEKDPCWWRKGKWKKSHLMMCFLLPPGVQKVTAEQRQSSV